MAKSKSSGLEGALVPLIILLALVWLWQSGKLEGIFNKLKGMLPSGSGSEGSEGEDMPALESITAQEGKKGENGNGNGENGEGNKNGKNQCKNCKNGVCTDC